MAFDSLRVVYSFNSSESAAQIGSFQFHWPRFSAPAHRTYGGPNVKQPRNHLALELTRAQRGRLETFVSHGLVKHFDQLPLKESGQMIRTIHSH